MARKSAFLTQHMEAIFRRNGHFEFFTRAMTGPRQDYRLSCHPSPCHPVTTSPPAPLSPLRPHKPYVAGTQKQFFSSKSKKAKRFVIFDPKKGGAIFSTSPPPSPPPPPSKTGIQVGGVWGGCPTQNSLGDAFIGPNKRFLRAVKPTFQPVGLGYAYGPPKGGMWRFPIYAHLRGFELTTSVR